MDNDKLDQVKETFKTHLRNQYIKGLQVGEKAMATAIISTISGYEAYEENPDGPALWEMLQKVISLCERTLNISYEDFVAKMNLTNEVFEAANKPVESTEEAQNGND